MIKINIKIKDDKYLRIERMPYPGRTVCDRCAHTHVPSQTMCSQ
jgi:uncharacterized OB-fold protein